MKRYIKGVLTLSFVLFGFAASAQQIQTWFCPASNADAHTNIVAANQVMELVSGSFDPDSQIDVIRGEDLFRMGSGGGANLNTPFAIAGPATVVFRKTATGGQGMMVSYRIWPQGATQTTTLPEQQQQQQPK